MPNTEPTLRHQRWKLLIQLHRMIEGPMVALALCWTLLMILDLTRGLNQPLSIASWAIWAVFVVDFLLEFTIAPRKLVFLRHEWLAVIALAVPAIRLVRFIRILRVLRVARSVRLVRVLTSLNRGLTALRRHFAARAFGYVLATTVLVAFAGAAGMYAFENPRALADAGVSGSMGLRSYSEALWWTAMVLTTMGSEYWPKTLEGRILCWVLALYSFAAFGYVTAALATFFIGRDVEQRAGGGRLEPRI